MKPLAIILIVLGALALAYQGFSYNKNEEVLKIGDASISATTKKRVSVPPYVGFILLGSGVALFIFSSKKT